MYHNLPPMTETAEDLRQRMRQEWNPKQRERLPMRYLLARGQAPTWKAPLGISRETVGHGQVRSTASGRAHLLDH